MTKLSAWVATFALAGITLVAPAAALADNGDGEGAVRTLLIGLGVTLAIAAAIYFGGRAIAGDQGEYKAARVAALIVLIVGCILTLLAVL